MTTINTTEDLLRALRENPDWRDAVRAQLLGEELLQLPVRFANFVTEQQQVNQELVERMDRLEEGQDRLEKDFAVMKQDLTEVKQDIAQVKGSHARQQAEKLSEIIAFHLEHEQVEVLGPGSLIRLARISGMPRNEMDSFVNADLVISVNRLDTHEPGYIAIEASYTVGENDVRRALRNAGTLAELTGVNSQAAVAGSRITQAALDLARENGVHWHEMATRDLEPE